MLDSLEVKDFTVFKDTKLEFSRGLNVIVGANGTGKTHLLKLPYAVMAMSVEESKKRNGAPTKTLLQTRIADKLNSVFRPEDRLGRLVHRQKGHFPDGRPDLRCSSPPGNCSPFVPDLSRSMKHAIWNSMKPGGTPVSCSVRQH